MDGRLMLYDEIDEDEQRPLSKRAFWFSVAAVTFFAIGYVVAASMPSKEQNCVAAGGDPWHCAQEYGRP